MLRALFLVVCLTPSLAFAGQAEELVFQLHFKAFCKNDLNEVQVAETNEAVTYRLELNADGSTKTSEPQVYHQLNSAGYQVYVTLEILRKSGAENFHIRLTPWRKMSQDRDISFGTAFVEQAQPSPLPRLGVAVNETINEAKGSYCTLTATIASK